MYKLRFYATTGQLKVRYFDTVSEALRFAVYKTPFQSFYGIDKVEL